MGVPSLQRLLLLLTAFAFLLAAAAPGPVPSVPGVGGMTMAGSSGHPCGDCSHKAPANTAARVMPCGALACAGVFAALPLPAGSYVPLAAKFAYASQVSTSELGLALLPDPFPPRPAPLV